MNTNEAVDLQSIMSIFKGTPNKISDAVHSQMTSPSCWGPKMMTLGQIWENSEITYNSKKNVEVRGKKSKSAPVSLVVGIFTPYFNTSFI